MEPHDGQPTLATCSTLRREPDPRADARTVSSDSRLRVLAAGGGSHACWFEPLPNLERAPD